MRNEGLRKHLALIATGGIMVISALTFYGANKYSKSSLVTCGNSPYPT
jgi:hypothetical protein